MTLSLISQSVKAEIVLCTLCTIQTQETFCRPFPSQCLPEDDVAVSSEVLPPVDDARPLSPRPDAEHGVTLVGEGLEVPLLGLKHVLDAICAHGHHHLRAGLGIRDTHSFRQVQLPTDTCVHHFIQEMTRSDPPGAAPGRTSRVTPGCRSLSATCSDRRSCRCSCSKPSLLERRRAGAGGRTRWNPN